MHTLELKYDDYDIAFSEEVESNRGRTVYFHYNSDLSGEVVIEHELAAMRVPGWMLKELVGRFYASEAISKIEDRLGRQLLDDTFLR